jgi:CPSF A subunit region
LAGVGHTLRAYELGLKKFLKKAELRELNSPVTKIKVKGDRIFCSEMKDSIQVFNYKPKE